MTARSKGKLIIIGGHEDKEGDQNILEEVARCAGDGKLILMTAASEQPEELAQDYTQIFGELGVRNIHHIDIRTRQDAQAKHNIDEIRNARVIFFTGGDQLRITSQIGDSPLYQTMLEAYQEGTIIAGTSAGAAVMPETMLISGASDQSNRNSDLNMAPGLGLLEGVVIDSHFAERGRMGRLLGAVARNAKNIGIGIDEDTAIIVEPRGVFRVIGSGAVYIADAASMKYSSLSDDQPGEVLSIFDVRVHVLAEGDHFSLKERQPVMPAPEKA